MKLWPAILIAHLLAAWFSVGFVHMDEHFQIFEMAWFRSGLAENTHGVAWEYAAQIRSGLAPWIVATLAKTFPFLSSEDLARGLRLAASLLGFFSLYRLWKAWNLGLSENRNLAALFFGLSWFLPFLHARFSSESIAGSLFFIGISSLVSPVAAAPNRFRRGRIFGTALLLGLSTQFRYQMGLAVVGFTLWWLWERRPDVRSTFIYLLGGAASVGIGALADHWFYNEWTFPAWSFVHVNIFQNKAAQFGVHPWWYYFPNLAIDLMAPPWGILWLVLSALGLFHPRARPLLFSIVPFLGLQSLISHKEMRFLFPLASAFPVLAALGWEKVPTSWARFRTLITHPVGWALSGVLLLTFALKPARFVIQTLEFLNQYAEKEPVCLISEGVSPLKEFVLEMNFYRSRAIHYLPPLRSSLHTSKEDSETPAPQEPCRLVLVHRGLSQGDEITGSFPEAQLLHQSLPTWIRRFDFNGWVDRARLFELWDLGSVQPANLANSNLEQGLLHYAQAVLTRNLARETQGRELGSATWNPFQSEKTR